LLNIIKNNILKNEKKYFNIDLYIFIYKFF
jgi:hypothetical protein